MPLIIDPERWALIERVGLSTGRHDPPGPGEEPKAICLWEAITHAAHLPWSDHPGRVCPTIEAAARRVNDATDRAGRARQLAWVRANLGHLERTAGDGHGAERGYLAVDVVMREVMPVWLWAIRATETSKAFRMLPTIVDAATAREAGEVVDSAVRIVDRRRDPVSALRSQVYRAVERVGAGTTRDRAADDARARAAGEAVRDVYHAEWGFGVNADMAGALSAVGAARDVGVSAAVLELVAKAARVAARVAAEVVVESGEVVPAAVEAAMAQPDKVPDVKAAVMDRLREQGPGLLDAWRQAHDADAAMDVVLRMLDRMVAIGDENLVSS